MRNTLSMWLLATLIASPSAYHPASAQDKTSQAEKRQFGNPLSGERLAAIAEAVPQSSTAVPKKARRALCFCRCGGFVHSSISSCNAALEALGSGTKAFSVDVTDDYSVFTPENLQQFDCIILNNTTNMEFPEASQLNAFMDFVIDGKGLVGIHAASDNFGRHPEARAMIGGEFGGHPWGAGGTWAFKLNEPNHALNQAFDGKGFWHKDEIYQYNPATYVGTDVLRVLVSLDMGQAKVAERIDDGPREVPVSWVRRAGEGRVFYTNFGHNESTYENPTILQHLLDGIQYAMGDLAVDDAPTANADSVEPALAPAQP
ncbi:MAG: ThuA domain-containing protein [Pirellulaceae bacterium]|jgi:type 1 glutamine amidotransferase|nr:ThuA domain-containing protein [Pirellulaceae bacterium]